MSNGIEYKESQNDYNIFGGSYEEFKAFAEEQVIKNHIAVKNSSD